VLPDTPPAVRDLAGRGGAGFGPSEQAVDAGGRGAAAVWSVAVDSNDVSRWFGEYLDAFAACGRGESDTGSLLGYYGVPLLLTTGGGFFALTSDEQVVAAVQQQVDGMRAAAYGRSEILDSEVTVLNSTWSRGASPEAGAG